MKNIVVLHSDQYRFDAMSCSGNVFIDTPNLDRLAREGIRFSHAYTLWPLCTPARASTWTGLYPHNNGITYNVAYGNFDEADAFDALGLGYKTVFEHLHDAGWTTGYIGKWHLGFEKPRYFDYWEGFNSTGGHWVDGLQAHQGGKWLPDLETEQAVAFMQESGGPFCLTIGWYPPHDPYTAPTDLMEQFRGKGIPISSYYASCAGIDRNVGRIVSALDDLGLAENTLVIFVADHGETFCNRDGVIGNKLVCHDESIRIPLIVRYPGETEPGTIVDAPVGVHDLMPTILGYAGLELPENLDGQDLRDLVGDRPVKWRDHIYIENQTSPMQRYSTGSRIVILPPTFQRAIRTSKWKLVLSDNGLHSLFDLEHDPEELLDIFGAPYEEYYDQYRHYEPTDEIVGELAKRLRAEAEALSDSFGVELAERVLGSPIKRPKLDDLPNLAVSEMWPV